MYNSSRNKEVWVWKQEISIYVVYYIPTYLLRRHVSMTTKLYVIFGSGFDTDSFRLYTKKRSGLMLQSCFSGFSGGVLELAASRIIWGVVLLNSGGLWLCVLFT
jgi:hypothetical protein